MNLTLYPIGTQVRYHGAFGERVAKIVEHASSKNAPYVYGILIDGYTGITYARHSQLTPSDPSLIQTPVVEPPRPLLPSADDDDHLDHQGHRQEEFGLDDEELEAIKKKE